MEKKFSLLQIYRKEFKKHSYLKQLFFTYALVSCLLFFLFSTLIIYSINDDYQETLTDVQEQTVTQSYQLNQTVLQDIYAACYTLMNSGDLPRIIYGSEYNSTLALKATELQNQLKGSSSLVHSVYLINFSMDTVLDNFTKGTVSEHYDTGLFAFLEELTPSSSPFYGLPREISKSASSSLTSDLRIFSVIYYASQRGAVVINIDYDSYARLLGLEDNDYLSWMQVDRNGSVIAASDASLFGTDVSDNTIYQQVGEHSAVSGSFETKAENAHYRVFFRHNSGMGITYYSILNQSALYTGNHLITTVLFFGIAFILFGLLAAFVISFLVYRPVRRFKEQIAQSSSTEISQQAPGIDDFTYLSTVYKDITSANKRLQTINHAWLKEKDRSMLKKLMTNSGSVRILPGEYEALSQYFSKNNYQIVVISIDYVSRQNEDISSLNLLKYAISNVMNELFETSMLSMNIDIVSPNVVYFINHDDEDETNLRSLILQGQEFLQSNYEITLSFGIGEAVTELDEISLSYSGALDALSRRFLSGNSSIHFASELTLTPQQQQYYPYEADSAVISSIKAQNTSGLQSALDDFFETIRSFHLDQIIRSILQLDAAMQRLETAGSLNAQPLPWGLDELVQLDIATVHEYFLTRGMHDMEELGIMKTQNSEKPELIQSIIEMTEANLDDPNLSVSFLAGEVGLSINYLRSVFKENTGESLSAYINRKRVERICSLLTDTDLSIQDISDKLGFSTKNYFFTFFKKHMQVTPNEYRKKMRSEQSEE